MASLAEAGTLQLEFKYLSHLTGDYTYWDKAERVGCVMVRCISSLAANSCIARSPLLSLRRRLGKESIPSLSGPSVLSA